MKGFSLLATTSTMSFGYHCGLKATLLETVTSQYKEQGAKCIQCYIGGNQTYTRRDFADGDLVETSNFMSATGFRLYTHSCLCMNLGSGFQKNIDTLHSELKPVLATGASTVVHIGSKNVNKQPIGTMDNVIYSIKELKVRKRENPKHQRWPILLENAAGEGSKFGSTMQDLKYLFDNLQDEGVGFCLDTAHCFAAGMFDLESKESIVEMFEVIEEDLGKDRLQLVHLNDSKIPFGGCNDRHECLGEGYIWKDSIDSCRILLQECRTRGIDVVLETPDVVRDYQLGCKLLRDEESCSSSSAETS